MAKGLRLSVADIDRIAVRSSKWGGNKHLCEVGTNSDGAIGDRLTSMINAADSKSKSKPKQPSKNNATNKKTSKTCNGVVGTRKEVPKRVLAVEDNLDWLDDILRADKDIAMGVMLGLRSEFVKSLSPHKRRFVALALDKSQYSTQKREHYVQVRLFYAAETKLPELYEVMYAVPNGGLRLDSVGLEMLAEGQKKGQLDINVDVAKGGAFGFRLEVKTSIGKPSPEQIKNVESLNSRGYKAVIMRGFDDCWAALENYWNLPPTKFNGFAV
ncbi:hypothetical protein [Photobacterium kishitanii]|uniref:VRR-NUC domain-containing protein n=1 Tax=Photobacterium kishitanii TaxID=318456 RepID=A0A2T3KM29_9GAMM|nr:hypothetical protein [Photobacterium kishitanii]PSV00727.1 hypothetical protein C9J27_06180 [Photobacterium kishitanii]